MVTNSDIIEFLEEKLFHQTEVKETSTLQGDLSIWGDDMDEVLEAYAEEFNVDMSSFLWYFHTREEGTNFGGFFFTPPNEKVEQIPITIPMLCEYANDGKWNLEYPDHEIPERRPDILINQILVVVFFVFVVISCVKSRI